MVNAYFRTSGYWWLNTVTYHLCTIILLIIWLKHTYNTISDLCTAKRASLKHRPKPPEINTRYILSTILTEICITSYSILLISSTLTHWAYFPSITSCPFMSQFGSIFYTISKTFLYSLFLSWLHSVYGSSPYQYSPKLLTTAGILNIVYCLMFIVLLSLYTMIDQTAILSPGEYGNLCNPSFPAWMVILFGAYDIVASILFMAAFNYPLWSVRKHEKKLENVMRHTAIKSKILIITVIVSTLLVFGVLAVTNSALLNAIDVVINCICICLMTPYYPDDMYYNRLCGCCIKCAGKIHGANDEVMMDLEIQQTEAQTN